MITYKLMGLEHEKTDEMEVPQQNEMLSLYCTVLGFSSKNDYNPKQNIPNFRCLKDLILQKVVKL